MQLALAGYALKTVVSSGSTGRVELRPGVEQTATEVQAAVEAQQ